MKTHLECLPCLVRQSMEAARQATEDRFLQEKILRRILQEIARIDLNATPPVMGGCIQRIIREMTGDEDPYRQEKERCNQEAFRFYPECRHMIERSDDPLDTAIKLAIAGNIIDFAVNARPGHADLKTALDRCKAAALPADTFVQFKESVAAADRILYLGDNAGEIVLDRLLVEHLPPQKTTFVVRGRPVINDVTLNDARMVGITDLVEVIDNGSDIPGTVLPDCSESFQQKFREADLIISKGQGNFESLDGVDKPVFFLFTAKCPTVAAHLGCEMGTMVFQRHSGRSGTLADR